MFYALEGIRTEGGSTVNSQQIGVLDENDARMMGDIGVDFGCSGSLRGTIFAMLQSCLCNALEFGTAMQPISHRLLGSDKA
jgi:hypothetical protein